MAATHVTATYRFTRDQHSQPGFHSPNWASTDAVNLISCWEAAGAGRAHSILDDREDYLVAELSFPAFDADEASTAFHALCTKFGLKSEAAMP